MSENRLHILLLGATGLVGKRILELALQDECITNITAPTRRALPPNNKLHNPIVDFENLPDAQWWKTDAVLCALGTTIKQAGSQAAFRNVDFQYVLSAANLAKAAGSRVFVLNSSLGADHRSKSFYLKVKGETEQALEQLGFDSLTVVRPSLLDGGPRLERRYGEEIGLWMGNRLNLLIPKRYRPVSTLNVAKSMLEAACRAEPGLTIIESEDIGH
jgi:uncharacterized protein YbjT (DUF2867 family)